MHSPPPPPPDLTRVCFHYVWVSSVVYVYTKENSVGFGAYQCRKLRNLVLHHNHLNSVNINFKANLLYQYCIMYVLL